MLNYDANQGIFIKHPDADVVCEELKNLFAAEGMLPSTDAIYPKHKEPALSCQHWVVQVLAGNAGWILLRTSPRALFAERPASSPSPRLSSLCKKLGVPAFMLLDTVYETEMGEVLMEVQSTGEAFVSGYWITNYKFNNDFFGSSFKLDTKEIVLQTEFMQKLIEQVDSAIIKKSFASKPTCDLPPPFTALGDELTPALVKYQNYEISRDFNSTGGKTLFFCANSL
ncbi:MAG: hypothetical protein LBE81_09445 [Azonexus sp.]|jgi:hypothetical protein|uniref:hypothetical protein n=1 Tax=Azonexus sp. TaxID=1872668 RepID=UPI002832347B|nr:hypothetical protein [Azonexus sp.]MDR0776846.1 hypothetical protein [Azonexus sp.]